MSLPMPAAHRPAATAARYRRSSRRAAVGVPRIAHGAEVRVLAGDAEGELVQVVLAQDDRAGLFQSRNDRGVLVATLSSRIFEPKVVGHAGDVEQVLDADGTPWSGPR